jgi:hypothetical protein
MAHRRYGGGCENATRLGGGYYHGSTGEMREDDATMAVKVGQRSRGGGGGGGDLLGGGRAAQSHGEEIVVIFFLLVNLLCILLPFLCRRQRN